MKREDSGAFPDEFARDDAFIDDLARGVDPSGGTDPLAAALLALKNDVDRPMPAPPSVVQEPAPVASLDDARARRRPTSNPWVAGLVGAAAASTVILGTGAAVLSAETSSNETTMVELATTLDELEAASESGDEAAARDLLEQARGLLASIRIRESRHGDEDATPAPQPRTVTETVTVSDVPEATTIPDEQSTTPQPAGPAPATAAPEQPTAQPNPVQSSTVHPSAQQPNPAPSTAASATASQQPETRTTHQNAADETHQETTQHAQSGQTGAEYGGSRTPAAGEGSSASGVL